MEMSSIVLAPGTSKLPKTILSLRPHVSFSLNPSSLSTRGERAKFRHRQHLYNNEARAASAAADFRLESNFDVMRACLCVSAGII